MKQTKKLIYATFISFLLFIILSFSVFSVEWNQPFNKYDGRYVNIPGDTMTGTLNISTGNLSVEDVLFVDSTLERVGIGNTAPAVSLEVGDATGEEIIRVSSGVNSNAILSANSFLSTGNPLTQYIVAGGNNWVTGVDNADNDKYKISFHITDLGTNTRLTIDGTGKVGINTTGPQANLQVDGTTILEELLVVSSPAECPAGTYMTHTNLTASICVAAVKITGDDRMFGNYSFNNGGFFVDGTNNRTGIGTTSPQALLSVESTNGITAGKLFVGSNSVNRGFELGYNDGGNTVVTLGSNHDNVAARMDISMRLKGTEVKAISILGSGNVGIGTDSPTELLEVAGAIRATLDFQTNAASAATFGYTTSGEDGAFIVSHGANATTKGSFRIIQRASDGSPTGTPFFIDNAGDVGIGTTSPSKILHVLKTQNSETAVYIDNQGSSTAATTALYVQGSGSGYGQFTHFGGGYTTNGLLKADLTWLTGGDDLMIGTRVSGKDLIFHTNGFTAANERMRISSNGDIIMNNSNLFVDVSANSVGMGTNTPASTLVVVGDVNITGNLLVGGLLVVPNPIHCHSWSNETQTIGTITSWTNLTYNRNVECINITTDGQNFTIGTTGAYAIQVDLFVDKTGGATIKTEAIIIKNGAQINGTATHRTVNSNNEVGYMAITTILELVKDDKIWVGFVAGSTSGQVNFESCILCEQGVSTRISIEEVD